MNTYRKVPTGLGALSCIGKDFNKRKIIVPTDWLRSEIYEINKETNIFKKTRTAINKFTGRLIQLFDKNKYKEKVKEKMVSINATLSKRITNNYMAEVSDRIEKAQAINLKNRQHDFLGKELADKMRKSGQIHTPNYK